MGYQFIAIFVVNFIAPSVLRITGGSQILYTSKDPDYWKNICRLKFYRLYAEIQLPNVECHSKVSLESREREKLSHSVSLRMPTLNMIQVVHHTGTSSVNKHICSGPQVGGCVCVCSTLWTQFFLSTSLLFICIFLYFCIVFSHIISACLSSLSWWKVTFAVECPIFLAAQQLILNRASLGAAPSSTWLLAGYDWA